MEAHEVGDTITEAAEHHSGNERERKDDAFRRRTGIVLGIIAMLLAIASLGGENATKETVNSNISASDAYAFYQAKDIRQTANRLASHQMEALLTARPDLPPEARAGIEQRIAEYRATIARYESDPEQRNGKKELLAQARGFEERRNHAQRQDINFDYGRALFQIAIVLGSVSIVAASRPLLWACIGLAGVATLLSLNGFFLFYHLPLE